MSSGYGRADGPNLSGGLWSQGAGASPSEGAPPAFAASAYADSYPHKYLGPRGRQAPARSGPTGGEGATLPLALLFPILVLLMLSVTLQQESTEGFDVQLGVRFAAYALAALSVFFALGTQQLRLNVPVLAWVLVPAFITVTALYSSDPLFSFTAGLGHLALLLFAWRMVTRHGQPRIALVLVITGMIIGALSIVAYYFFPDLGRLAATGLTAESGGGRMRGVTAQPNTLGAISALTLLLAVMHFRMFTARQRVIALAAMAIAAFCIFYSDSRTSIAALLLCLLLWRVCRANAAFNLFAVVAIALVACLILIFVPDVSAYLSRSGGPDELASLNGRSRIWAVAWESIWAHPMFGQGYGSSRLLLPLDDRLFGAAVNTHNVYMELLFSGGAVLFGLFVVAVAIAIFRSASQGRAEALIALLFFLVRGAGEAAPYGALPLFPAFAFYTAVSLCLLRSPMRGQVPPERSSLRPVGSAAPVAGARWRAEGLQQ